MKLSGPEVYAIHLANAAAIAPQYGLDAITVAQYATGLAWLESKFDTAAKNPKSTATGLMQINAITKVQAERNLKVASAPQERMYEASYNSLLSIAMLCYHLRRCGDVDKAISAYNQGNCGAQAMFRARGYLSVWKAAMRTVAQSFPQAQQQPVLALGMVAGFTSAQRVFY